MWAIAAMRGDTIVGVAIVGRPTARHLDASGLADVPQPSLQVLRVATVADAAYSGNKGANSILYGACARAGRAMGARDMSTYIHHDEPGTSLKASGWIEDVGFDSVGGNWGRPSRGRKAAVESGAKRRWWAPWSDSAPVVRM